MLVTRPAVRTCIGVLALAVALSALLLPQGFATSAQTGERDDGAFATLRDTIKRDVPAQLQPAFLAQVDAAEHLLLPAIQSGREDRRGAAVRILLSLQHQVEVAQKNKNFYFYLQTEAVIAAIDDVIDTILS